MIFFESLLIQGFRAFSEEQEFFLGRQKGFYFLSGENRVDEDLEGNGAGKSSVFDALCWILFGKTVRGLRAYSVKHWFTEELCKVELSFTKESKYKLVRTFSPNSLTLQKDEGEVENVTQEELEDILGLNYKAFLYQVVFGQFNKMFFDLGSIERAEVFSTALNLDKWVDRSNKASSKALQISGFISDVRNEVATFEGRLEQIKNTDVSDKIKEWSDSQNRKIRTARTEISGATTKVKSYKKDLQSTSIELKQTSKSLDSLDIGLKELEDKIKDMNLEISSISKEHAVAVSNCRRLEKEIVKKKSLSGTCTVCDQKISKDYVKQIVTNLKQELDVYEDTVRSLDSDLAKEEKNKRRIQRDLRIIETDFSKLQVHEQNLERKITRLESDIRQAESSRNRAERDLEQYRQEKNPYEEQRLKLKEDENKIIILLDEKQEELDVLISSWKSVNYWVKGFKDLRLYLISQALRELEIEVNSNIDKLGLPGWEISFDVDKETKSKTIKKGFHVFVKSPQSPKDVPWESWSGGESQRLRVAGAIGLANMLEARTGVCFNLEVWDEPTQWLSDSGVQDLLDLLYSRSKQVNKQVWLVDHRCFDYGHFSKEVVVVKTEEGSMITDDRNY